MAKFKNLILIPSDFSKIPNKFLEIFNKDYNEMVLLLRLMNTMETFNSWDKLNEDKSFYLSIPKMIEMFGGNISHPTIIKYLKNLEEKNFIKIIKNKNPKPNYYIVNCEQINKLCDTNTKRANMDEEIEPEEEIQSLNQPIKNEIKVVEAKDEVVKPTETATLQSVKEEMASYWNRIAKDFNVPSVRVISDSDVKKIKSIIKEFGIPSIRDFFAEIYKAVGNSEHLRGNNDRCWKIHFSFLTQKSSMEKLFNFAYQSHEAPQDKTKALFDPSTYTKTELADIREIVAGLKRCKANGNTKFYGFYIQDLAEKYNIPEDVVTSELLENSSFIEIENEDIKTLN